MVNTKKIRKVSSEGAYPLLIFQHSDLGGVNFVEKFVYCQELNLIDNPALMKWIFLIYSVLSILDLVNIIVYVFYGIRMNKEIW